MIKLEASFIFSLQLILLWRCLQVFNCSVPFISFGQSLPTCRVPDTAEKVNLLSLNPFSLIATSQCGVLGEQLSVRGVGKAGQAVQPAVRQDARLLWIPIF